MLLRVKAKNSVAGQSQTHASAKMLCVATTHILFNPKRGDCKLAQMQLLLAHLDRVAYKETRVVDEGVKLLAVPAYHPTVLCGDLNCTNDSKFYEFVARGKLVNYRELNRNATSGQLRHPSSCIRIERILLPEQLGISDQSQFMHEVEWRLDQQRQLYTQQQQKSTSVDEEPQQQETDSTRLPEAYCSYGGSHLRHTFRFRSAYKHVDANNELEVTTSVNGDHKHVDYIFFHSEELPPVSNATTTDASASTNRCLNELELLARLELFPVSALNKDVAVGMPNSNYPSDHFLLAAKFRLT